MTQGQPLGLGVARRALLAFVPRGAIALLLLTLAAYAMGLARDRAFARTFGAGAELDAYNAALVVPELVLSVLVLAGLSAAFVPVFSSARREDPDRADRFARTVLAVSATVMAFAVAVLLVVAPLTADVVVPGFDETARAEYVLLFRVMCVTALVFAVASALGEMLAVRQRFVAYGAAPIAYNAGIVAGTLVLGPTMGIMGAALGTVGGSLLYLAVRLVGIRRTDATLRPLWEVRSPAFGEYIRLALPKALSQPIVPLMFLYFTRAASHMDAGSVSAVSFARNFASVPVSLVGVAFSVAAFPVVAAAAAAGEGTGSGAPSRRERRLAPGCWSGATRSTGWSTTWQP